MGHTVRAAALALLVVACGSAPPSTPIDPPGQTAAPSAGAPTAGAPTAPPTAPAGPGRTAGASVPVTGFAFDAASVLGYYQSVGFTCDGPVPGSTPGSTSRSCQLLDPDGRVRVVALTTDTTGALVAGFASMRGMPGEAFLDPELALEPLAGFLGAMLGEARGTELVPWLAGHLGDGSAETASGDLSVLTYTEDVAGQTVLFVEVATDAFRSTATPTPS